MRILNAMLGRGLGGIEQSFLDYCEALRFSGHEAVALIHPRAQVRPALEKTGIPVHSLTNWGAWDPVAAFRLGRLLKRLKPDAAIAHGNRAVSLLVKARARRVIGVMHNYTIRHEPLRCLLCPTQDLMRLAQAEGGTDKQAFLVPNLVRVPVDEPVRYWHEPPVIGAMGRMVSKKGFDVFIEAVALLKARRVPFAAVLAGDGEEMESLKALAAKRDLSDRLRFTGWVRDKSAFFEAIDVFCMPSLHEPFGIALLEAMAQALPVVAADSEGPSEILGHAADGVLVPRSDPAALAEALALLLADRQHAALLARNAYDAVKRRFDLPVVAGKLDLALRAFCRL